MSESYIVAGEGHTAFVGPDAMRLVRATTLRAAIAFHKKTGMQISRTFTITTLLRVAGEFSGKTYKRGQHQAAIDDLTVWIETMKAALPMERRP